MPLPGEAAARQLQGSSAAKSRLQERLAANEEVPLYSYQSALGRWPYSWGWCCMALCPADKRHRGMQLTLCCVHIMRQTIQRCIVPPRIKTTT